MGRRRLAGWFLVGFVAALFLQWAQARATGGWGGLLSVGETSGLRPLIESELGSVPLVPFGGHDGQISYAIARQPFGGEVSAGLVDAGYRYRRILYPLLAGGGGSIAGSALLAGLVGWAAVGVGLATAASASLARRLGMSGWAVAGVLANPGVWLSVQLLTPDALAFGLAMTGVALWLTDHPRWTLLALALAVLAKDQFLLVALGLAGWELTSRRRRAVLSLAILPVIPLLAWAVWLGTRMPGGLSPRGNLGPPFVGILGSVRFWADRPTKDIFFGTLALLAVGLCIWTVWKAESKLVRWLAAPWALVGVLSSTWLWDFGNNALRALAPALFFGLLGSASQPASTSRRNLPV